MIIASNTVTTATNPSAVRQFRMSRTFTECPRV
jgi:hypothetical protein